MFYVDIPEGYEYEVSAPRPLRAIAALGPYYSLEDVSCVHDYVYSQKGKDIRFKKVGGENDLVKTNLTRREADYVMISDESDPAWIKYPAYWYVRALGWWAWNGWDEWLSDKIEAVKRKVG